MNVKRKLIILKRKAIPKEIKMSQWLLKFQKIILDISDLKVPSFIYSCRLVQTLQRIKVRVLKNFEDFCIETFIRIHSFDDAKHLKISVVPSL